MTSSSPTTIQFNRSKNGARRGGCYLIFTLNLPPKNEKDEGSRPTVEVLRNAGSGMLILLLNDHKNSPDSIHRAEIPTHCSGSGQVTFAPEWIDGPIVCSVVAEGRTIKATLSLERDAEHARSIQVERPIVTSSSSVERAERAIKEKARPTGDSDSSERGGWHVPTGVAPASRGDQEPAVSGTNTGCQERRTAAAAAVRGQSFDEPPRSLFASTPTPRGTLLSGAMLSGTLPSPQPRVSLHGHHSGGGWRHAAGGWRHHRPMR